MAHRHRLSDLVLAALLLLMAVSVLMTAYSYTGGSGVFPRFIGWIFLVLCLMEFVIQCFFMFYKSAPPDFETEGTASVLNPDVYSEIKGFMWLGLLVLFISIVGFMVAIPVFLFLFLRISAGKSAREGIVFSVLLSVFIYILFIWLLEYRLYSGILFG